MIFGGGGKSNELDEPGKTAIDNKPPPLSRLPTTINGNGNGNNNGNRATATPQVVRSLRSVSGSGSSRSTSHSDQEHPNLQPALSDPEALEESFDLCRVLAEEEDSYFGSATITCFLTESILISINLHRNQVVTLRTPSLNLAMAVCIDQGLRRLSAHPALYSYLHSQTQFWRLSMDNVDESRFRLISQFLGNFPMGLNDGGVAVKKYNIHTTEEIRNRANALATSLGVSQKIITTQAVYAALVDQRFIHKMHRKLIQGSLENLMSTLSLREAFLRTAIEWLKSKKTFTIIRPRKG